MNAYKEIFAKTVIALTTDKEFFRNLEELEIEATVVEITTNSDKARNRRRFEITPNIDSEFVSKWMSAVRWAKVGRYAIKSKRSKEDEIAFLEGIASINYDDDYGTQELFGTIVFNNGSWMERREYDGSEWWSLCKCPEEPDWNNIDEN